jgi:hypothetical protein
MIRLLTYDEIARNWKIIQYGAVMVNRPVKMMDYSLNLLKNLFTGRSQVWFWLNDDKKIKMMLITRIHKDEGEIGHLLIETAYGFIFTEDKEWQEIFDNLVSFANKLKLESIIAYSLNSRIISIADNLGMSKGYLFRLKLGEENG